MSQLKIAAFDLMVRLVYLVVLTNLYGCMVHTVVGILGLATLIQNTRLFTMLTGNIKLLNWKDYNGVRSLLDYNLIVH